MFHFGGFPILTDSRLNRGEVLLGDPRITDSLRLPGAFRCLARPSSALKPNHSLTGIRTRFLFSGVPKLGTPEGMSINFLDDCLLQQCIICGKWNIQHHAYVLLPGSLCLS